MAWVSRPEKVARRDRKVSQAKGRGGGIRQAAARIQQWNGIGVAKSARMYPLLVNAIAATASNLIDRWAQSRMPKATASSVPFSQMLDGASTPQRSAAATIAQLRSELLSSPEIRTAMDSSDPMHPLSLQLSPDGNVTAQAPGQNARPLALSPQTAMLARSLAAMLPANATL